MGFIGAAPFAWGLLAGELEAGRFARGLWYFFGIVTTAGIFSGIAGLGIGHVIGLAWEQLHRNRRRAVLQRKKALPEVSAIDSTSGQLLPPSGAEPPRLQLVVPENAPLPSLVGRRLTSIRFLAEGLEMDFSGARVAISGSPTITCGAQRYRFPEAGSRDALCNLIGSRVERMHAAASDRLELGFDIGCELVTTRSGTAVA